MKRSIVSGLVAVLAVCSCQVKEMDELTSEREAKVFTAIIEDNNPETKTSLDNNGNVLWKQRDQVSIFAGSTINEQYQVTDESDGETSASLYRVTSPGFVAGTDIDNNVTFYPYSSSVTIAKSESAYILKKITLPSTQNYAEGSFGNGAFPMTAVTNSTSDYNLKFKNVLGGLKLQLKGTASIASISIEGNNNEILCGAAEVTVANGSAPAISLTDATAKTVTLDCGNGVQLNTETATPFIIALPAMTMNGGFTVTVTDTDGATMEIKTTKPQTITRSNLLKMPALTYEGTAPAPEHQYVDLGLPSGLKWATCNVGATAPEEYGDYFAWGETEPYYSSQDPLIWKDGKTGYNWSSYKFELGTDLYGPFSKYVTNATFGTVDNKTVLDPEDDAARANWGGSWRMPTDAEWTELRTKCTWTWTTQNEINGYLVTGPNGNRIFLPAAGGRENTYLLNAGSIGHYRSSSLYTLYPNKEWFVIFGWDYVKRDYLDYRYSGYSIRPVTDEGVRVSVSGLSLNLDSLELEEGSTATLSVTVTPSNATQPAVIWSSSDPSKATVDYTGVVTAVSEGAATITATTYDGGFVATCDVVVPAATLTVPEAVDLGLSVKWAPYNVGASRPSSVGGRYAWGEIETKTDYFWSNYKWCNGTPNNLTKYVGEKTILDPEDDVASVLWGEEWRMPSPGELSELLSMCTWTPESLDNVSGYRVTGPNGNTIFIPQNGQFDDSGHSWESSVLLWANEAESGEYAFRLQQSSTGYNVTCGNHKHDGLCVRPVYDDLIHVTSISIDTESLTLVVGDTEALTATVAPDNAKDQSVVWSSSDSQVVTVSTEGAVTAVGFGEAVITVTSHDGNYTSTCSITVYDGKENGYYWVDLGLPSGLKWATNNIGAVAPEGMGDHYAWGEVETKNRYDWSTHKWCEDSHLTLTKYNTQYTYGSVVDNKTILEPADDAASVNWGDHWRLPTRAEFENLLTGCTKEWITLNEMRGIKLTSKYNGHSIFFPTAGYRSDVYLHNVGGNGLYWYSSINPQDPSSAYCMGFYDETSSWTSSYGRERGYSVRAVTDKGIRVSASGISLDRDSLELEEGSTATLSVTVTPSNATQPAVIWSSSNIAVATVDFTGKVSAIAAGSTTITATTYDGGFTATCIVTVSDPNTGTLNGYAWVDLGLPSGLKWATRNVGATSPEETGYFFSWGEVDPTPKSDYQWGSYSLCEGGYDSITKFNNTDNLIVLEAEDDAATVNMGGDWRTPTVEDLAELINSENCTWTWTVLNGVSGYEVRSTTNNKCIFLPSVGYKDGGYYNEYNVAGLYWSSTRQESGQIYLAHRLRFDDDEIEVDLIIHRGFGITVRGVR